MYLALCLCPRGSGTAATTVVMYVFLCYVSDPAVRQQRQVCCMWRYVMSQTQWYVNNGKCGVCGDPWGQPSPRDNEAGGRYGKGIITRTYTPGQVIQTSELSKLHICTGTNYIPG